ncbi:WbqC family protein [Pontibacter sp. JH31]|uniref:WbqC family protein n=1 Tax=Pontibacter aquaedesilientis TaxID=2766980 RepID=A0ABR7XF89_9BACT|nr:WbqC family protein [Pontibacter aquaedesilientis]MBD1396947.1 WbqC family protein [Pontibacter aquaedesilientis]
MTLAIMQPYIFPYIGYFQLINAVDKFVIYDDVNFIKQGWINRNRILLHGKEHLFTVPLEGASSFKLIRETELNYKSYRTWEVKFLKSLEQSYKKASNFGDCFELMQKVFKRIEGQTNIADLAVASIVEVCNYLELKTEIKLTSTIYDNQNLSAQSRVIDICIKEAALKYINPEGGQSLYDHMVFEEHGLQLKFIKVGLDEYKQFNLPFSKGLSIIDVLMFNPRERVKQMVNNYNLL